LIDARLFSSFATAEDRGRALSALGLDDAVTVAPDGHANGEEMGRSLAQLALPRVDLLRSCLDELEASSVTLRTDALTMPWFASTAAAFGQIRQLHQNASELARVRQDLAAEQDIGRRQVAEITLLRDQLGLQQSETQGALFQTADQQQQEVGILKQLALKAEQEARDARKALRAFQDDAEAERKRLSAENDRLQEQLTRHQAELQQALADRSDKADDPASGPEPDGNIAALHGELGLLRGQMGLQLTETARQEQDALRRQELRNKAAYESERALARALTDLRTEAEERKAFQDRLQETEANRLALEEERNILSQKLNEVLSSRSWRITRPLRQARLTVAPIPDDQ